MWYSRYRIYVLCAKSLPAAKLSSTKKSHASVPLKLSVNLPRSLETRLWLIMPVQGEFAK
jgi:hypothetical protein